MAGTQVEGAAAVTTTAPEGETPALDVAAAVESISQDLDIGVPEGEQEEAAATTTTEAQPSTKPGEKPPVEGQPPATAAAKTGEEEEEEVDDPSKPPESPYHQDPAQPPKSWRAEAAAAWANIPPVIQAEIHRREADMYRGLEHYKVGHSVGNAFKRAVEPFMPTLQRHGLDPFQHTATLMQYHAQLALGTPEQKLQMFRQLAADYQIPLDQVLAEAPALDPQVAALTEELSGIKSAHEQLAQRMLEEKRGQLTSEVSAFAADTERHPYFNEVADEIVRLFQVGAVRTLKEAYEKAVWTNPVVRQREIARIQAASSAKSATDAAAKVQAAASATAANLKSKPKPASSALTGTLGSIDDTLNETMADIKKRDAA